MQKVQKSAEWNEFGLGVPNILACEKPAGWVFWKRVEGEDRWALIDSTPALIARAEEEYRKITVLMAQRRAAAQDDEPKMELMSTSHAA